MQWVVRGGWSAPVVRASPKDSTPAMTFDSEDITFTVLADVDSTSDEINRMAQEQWDAIFAESSRTMRTTQPRLIDVSPASDDGLRSAYHFTGTLFA